VPAFEGPGALDDGKFVVFSLPAAQRLFDRGSQLDVIYVEPVAGQDVEALKSALDSVVGPHNGVLDASQGPPEVAAALADFVPLFSLLALFSLGTGSMLVYNTVTLAVEHRRRELAVTGALGGSRRAVVVTILAEAGVVGFVGGLAGAVGGVLVAGPIVGSLATYTERVAGIPLAVRSSPAQLAAGALLGLLLGLAGALPGARRATRVDVVDELSGRSLRAEASTPHLLRRLLISGSVTGGGLALVWVAQRNGGLSPWQYPLGGLGFGVAAIALLLFGASLAPLLIRAVRGLPSRWVEDSAPGRLAIANLTGSPGRTGVMVAALGAAATTAFVTTGFSHGFSSAIGDSVEENMAGVSVSSVGSGANVNIDAGIPQEAVGQLAQVDGVDQVFRGAVVLAGSRSGEVRSVVAYQDPWDADDDSRAVRGRLDLDRFEQGEALISTKLARDTGLRPGDLLSLPTPGGMAELPIQAVVHAGGTGDGWVSISYDTHVELFGSQPVRAMYAEAAPGVDYDDLADRIRDVDLGVDVLVETPSEVAADASDSIDRQMAPFWTLQRGLLAVAFVAALSTMLLIGVQRRRELAMLAAVGTAPGTLARMVLTEAGLVGAAAIALSLLGGFPMLWAMVRLSPLMMGYAVPFRPDWMAVPLAAVSVMLVVLLAAVWPAVRAARTDILAALRSE
jgi:putative ABC transport system permease protein